MRVLTEGQRHGAVCRAAEGAINLSQLQAADRGVQSGLPPQRATGGNLPTAPVTEPPFGEGEGDFPIRADRHRWHQPAAEQAGGSGEPPLLQAQFAQAPQPGLAFHPARIAERDLPASQGQRPRQSFKPFAMPVDRLRLAAPDAAAEVAHLTPGGSMGVSRRAGAVAASTTDRAPAAVHRRSL